MNTIFTRQHAAIALACAALAGCSGVQPVSYTGLQSAAYLRPNSQDTSGRVPYKYSTQVNWKGYTSVIVDPVTIYRGADNQFGTMSEQDKADLATYMQTAFTDKLEKRFSVVSAPGPNTLRLKLTLSGATTNTAVISPFTHFDMTGNVYNAVQAVRGREGMMSGSVLYAVEIYDAGTNRLLSAYVTKQYPGALNIPASLGSLSASKAGIDKGADMLLADLR